MLGKSLVTRKKQKIQEQVGNVNDFINSAGFWANQEDEHYCYMQFLRETGRFTHLNYGWDDGNSHTENLPYYRAMLPNYKSIMAEHRSRLSKLGGHVLSVDELVSILQASANTEVPPPW